MSKQGKRKITVELPKVKDLGNRPSVFERLGIKKNASSKINDYCRQWAQNGTCAYGKTCKFASTHTLISPSKQRAANKDPIELKKGVNKDDNKSRLHSTVVVRSGRSPVGEMENWDQNDLEYADTDVLEKRRKQLQRELEIQLKMESGKDARKEKKKTVVSSSSSRSSSSSSASSSSSGGSSSSSSTRESRKKGKKGKLKRNSSSSPEMGRVIKKKQMKSDPKRDKLVLTKKIGLKKDEIRPPKKHEMDVAKKKTLTKPAIRKKSLSPIKKTGGTPPINQKQMPKGYALHRNMSKSPLRKDKIRSVSRHSSKDKDKIKDRERDKDRDKDKERVKDRFRRSKSPKPRARSKSSQRRFDARLKEARNTERNRPLTPKSKQIRKDISGERHRKPSLDRKPERNRDYKDKSFDHRKDKHDVDKDRYDREKKDRLDIVRKQERPRDRKRDQDLKNTRGARDRDRGLNQGLKKPTKPMERLLPRPEERIAALAAISGNRVAESDKVTQAKERPENHDRARKPDRSDRMGKRVPERRLSVERDHIDYDRSIDRTYDRPHSLERNYRPNDRYENAPHEGGNHSPSYSQNRERHYDASYDLQSSHARGYTDPQDMPYEDHIEDHRNMEIGFNDRHGVHDHGWDTRDLPHDNDRPYGHHKEWEEEGFRGDVYIQDRHWPHREGQVRGDWTEKDRDVDGQWHGHRQPGNASNSRRIHDDGTYTRSGHEERQSVPQQHGSQSQKRTAASQRPHDTDNTQAAKRPCLNAVPPPPVQTAETEEVAIPDDLSEISDDPDDILNQDDIPDEVEQPAVVESAPCEPVGQEEMPVQKEIEPGTGVIEKKVELVAEQSEADDGLDSLDFEEISDGELEEDQKIKGLGDALGVDWASLVAEVRKGKEVAKGELNKQSNTSARAHWQPNRVLARIGVSIHMAGEEMVKEIVDEVKSDNKNKEKDIFNLHPVASIQVAMAKRIRERESLVGGGGVDIGGRALCARRDLALRRRLCRLPPKETTSAPVLPVDPEIYQRACALLVA